VSWTGAAITVYDPATDEWSLPAARCAPLERHSAELAWVEDGVVLWGGTVDCSDEPYPQTCAEAELQRAYFLSERALYAGSSDSGDCYCPQALGGPASP
jgi:hypothetical protein